MRGQHSCANAGIDELTALASVEIRWPAIEAFIAAGIIATAA